jgi:hypothetical protein
MMDMTNTGDTSSDEEPADRAACEHERRERAWQPAARWQAIQETIRWAESQATARRNTPQSCIERERRIRLQFGEGQGFGEQRKSRDF